MKNLMIALNCDVNQQDRSGSQYSFRAQWNEALCRGCAVARRLSVVAYKIDELIREVKQSFSEN